MPKKCFITGKRRNNGYSISHSHVRTKKIQQVNLQNKKIWSTSDKKWIRMRISAKAIKNLTKLPENNLFLDRSIHLRK